LQVVNSILPAYTLEVVNYWTA